MSIATKGERQTGAVEQPPKIEWDAVSKHRDLPEAIIGIGPAATGGNVLPVGEVAVLAGPGGTGKSRLALQLAVAAAACRDGLADVFGRPSATNPSLDALVVRCGPVVLVGYEDAPAWLRWRAERIAGDSGLGAVNDSKRLSAAVTDAPLWAPPIGAEQYEPTGPTATGEAVWERVQAIGARLVVLDPTALAVDFNRDGYPAGPVGHLYSWLRRRALEANAGVLLVTHTPKGTRNRAPGDVSADDVSGSHAWVDRSRAALVQTGTREDCRLTLTKANYAPTGKTWNLHAPNDPPVRWEIRNGEAKPDYNAG